MLKVMSALKPSRSLFVRWALFTLAVVFFDVFALKNKIDESELGMCALGGVAAVAVTDSIRWVAS